MTPKKNAIEKRLDQIETMWNEFAEQPEARLLRWVADSDNVQMLDVFLDRENEEVGNVPDLFLVFRQPFADPAAYAAVLRKELIRQYQDTQPVLAEDGISDDWTCPPPQPRTPGEITFLTACASFHEQHADLMDLLVLVLAPETVSDIDAWRTWLGDLMGHEIADGLRIMVVDDPEHCVLKELAEQHEPRVVTLELDVNMPAAYGELVRDIPGSGPGFTFRQLFVGLTSAAGAGNVQAAQRLAGRAAEIARQQQWPTLVAAVNMTLGATYFAQGDSAKTLECYRGAGQAVADAEPDDEAAKKVAVQSKFSEGSILFGDARYAEAAEVFTEGSGLAAEVEDDFQVMEGWRMAAFCHEQDGQPQAAWDAGQQALEAALPLEPDIRRETTLPYVGAGLLRLAESDPFADERDDLRQRLDGLMGAEWEQKIAPGATSS